MTLVIRLSGGFEVRAQDGQAVIIPGRRPRLLLAYLAMAHTRPPMRSELANLLWGDRDDTAARHSLAQALTTLRGALGPARSVLGSDLDTVWLEPGLIDVDAIRIRHWRPGNAMPATEELGSAFLDGVDIRGEAVEDWLLPLRRELLEKSIAILRHGIAATDPPCDAATRLAMAKRLLTLEPFDEDAHRWAMQAYLDQGDPDLAEKQFQRCRQSFRRELGIEPAPETVALWKTARLAARRPRAQPSSGSPVGTMPWDMARPSLPDRPSIAVLPFETIDGADYFADGFVEDIIVGLSRFRSIFVVARSSSFAFRGAAGLADAGLALGVRYVLHGSIRRSPDRLRVVAELTEPASGLQVWAERYNRPIGDVFEVQSELADMIVATLIGRIESAEARKSNRHPTDVLSAHDMVLRGKFLLHRGGSGDEEAARGFFAAAATADPDYALARVHLALIQMRRFFGDDSVEALDEAERLAESALSIDEAEAWAHMVLALCHIHRRRFDAAIHHGDRAVTLNPNDPAIAAKWGLILADVGQATDGITAIQRAMRLDPFRAHRYCCYLGLALFAARRHAEALRAFEVNPPVRFYDHVWLAACNAHLGRDEVARFHGRRVVELNPDFTIRRFASHEPIRDPVDMEHWLDGLRSAGIPSAAPDAEGAHVAVQITALHSTKARA